MIDFSIDIKNNFFRIDTKLNIQCSSFCLTFLVVKSFNKIKYDLEMEFFLIVQVKCWKICNTWRKSLMWPWSVRIMRGSEHKRWFWRLWVPFQGLFFRMMTRIHTLKLFIAKDFSFKFIIPGVQCRIYKKDYEDFRKI